MDFTFTNSYYSINYEDLKIATLHTEILDLI